MSRLMGAALAAALLCGALPAAAAPATTLTAVTFNLLHGGATSGLTGRDQELELRLAMAADELRRLSPDVVALQESSVSRRRGDVAARLAAVWIMNTSEPIQALVHEPSATASRRVDFMLLVPGTQYTAQVLDSRVVINTPRRLADGRTLWPSDHYGVSGELVLVPRPSRARP